MQPQRHSSAKHATRIIGAYSTGAKSLFALTLWQSSETRQQDALLAQQDDAVAPPELRKGTVLQILASSMFRQKCFQAGMFKCSTSKNPFAVESREAYDSAIPY